MLRAALERVEEYARSVAALGADRVPVGPFDVFFSRTDAPSYAVPARPTGGQEALRTDLAALAEAFRARAVPFRVELTLLLWPELPPALAAAGLIQAEDSPLFIVTPAAFRPRAASDLQVRWVAPGESPAFALSVVRQGFELRGPPPAPEEIAELRATLDGPLRLAIADLEGLPAGAGFSAPTGPTTELSALATLPQRRRRGVAAGLASFLVAEHFARGGDLAWGVTEDPRAAALLYGLGFSDAGLRVGWTESP